jgi:L-asparaginase / beta-aspartyl-peptidase
MPQSVLLMLVLWTGPFLSAVTYSGPPSAEEQVRTVLEKQESAWNRGRIDEFMETYEHSERLVFTSGGQVERGWGPTLERYRKRYPDRGAMGRLTFSDIEIRLIGDRAAVALGRWELHRRSDNPRGVFTLVLERFADGWLIVHDHTSNIP